ncbi:MAG: metallophosphoesterase, partial [Succinivibrio sp.]
VIVQLSDLHVSLPSTIEEMEDIVNTVNKLNADLVVITGDFVDGDIKTLDEKISPVFKIKSKHGIYAVSGNHEFYSGYEQWISYLEKGGIRFLENTSTIITTKDGRGILNLCGLIDPTGQNYGFDKPEILNAVKDIDPDLPVVFLSHQPKLADDLKKVSDLTLSGHTHGGLMPILKSIVKSANKGYVSGLYKIENQWLIVNNGTRIWAGIPLRIATPAEISVIKLSKK